MVEKTIYERALEKWGMETQIKICIEELAELIQTLIKHGRKINGSTIDDIAEEIADVELMIEQMKFAFDIHKDVEEWKHEKIERLKGYLNV
jgi:hypothetical protein